MNEVREERAGSEINRLENQLRRLWWVTIFSLFLAVLACGAAVVMLLGKGREANLRFNYGPAFSELNATSLNLVDDMGGRVELQPSGLRFFGPSGEQLIALSLRRGEKKLPALWIHGPGGRNAAGLYVGDASSPELFLSHLGGEAHLKFSPAVIPSLTLEGADKSKARYTTLRSIAEANSDSSEKDSGKKETPAPQEK